MRLKITPFLIVAFCASMWSVGAAGAYRVTHHGEPGLRHAIVKRAVVAVQEARHIKHHLFNVTTRQIG